MKFFYSIFVAHFQRVILSSVKYFYFSIVLLLMGEMKLVAQINHNNDKSETTQCVTDLYHDELTASFERRRSIIEQRTRKRGSNGNFEVHFYVDTSYERRRVGAYNKNNEVITYMNTLSNGIINKFNTAAPNWDVNKELTVTFYDSLTPFNYGNGIVETLENFLDWLIVNNFPGDDDMYIFYTGKYSNVGVTYLGTLCLPGVALVGFVNSQNPNEALSSHEWVGHSANSIHFDSVSNVMKSTNASFPWHIHSLEEVEDYLDFSSCVNNFQAPLGIQDIELNAVCTSNGSIMRWSVFQVDEGDRFYIQSSTDGALWYNVKEVEAGNELNYETSLESTKVGKLQYRIKLENKSGLQIHSNVVILDPCEVSRGYYIQQNTLYNPNHEKIQIINLSGIEIINSSDDELDLSSLQGDVIYFVRTNCRTEKVFLN